MMSISVVDPDDGEFVTAGPMSLRILSDGTLTDHRVGVMELTLPPGVAGPPQHIHHEHDETFYVVSGTPSFTCNTDVMTASAGTLLTAPPGTPHTFANPGDAPAVILCTITPDLYIDYFRELDRLPKTSGALDPVAVAEIMARYATEVFKPGT